MYFAHEGMHSQSMIKKHLDRLFERPRKGGIASSGKLVSHRAKASERDFYVRIFRFIT